MNYELIGFFGFRQKIKALRLCLKLGYATVTSENTSGLRALVYFLQCRSNPGPQDAMRALCLCISYDVLVTFRVFKTYQNCLTQRMVSSHDA